MKGVIAAVVSVALFRNQVTPKGCLGYAITVMGVFMYSESKRRAKAVRAAESAKSLSGEEGQALLLIKAGSGGGGGGGGAAVAMVSRPTSSCGGGGALPTSTQQLQQHRTSRGSAASGGTSSSGHAAVAIAVN